ncbi:MAG: class E sortase [bacterium]|nr:class E sortase [bacterium]
MRKARTRITHRIGVALVLVGAILALTPKYQDWQAARAEDQRWSQSSEELAELKEAAMPTTSTVTPRPVSTVTTTTEAVTTTTEEATTTTEAATTTAAKPTSTTAKKPKATTTTAKATTTTTPPMSSPLYPGDVAPDALFGWLTIGDLGKVEVPLLEGRQAESEDDIDKYALDHGVAHRVGTAFPGSGGNTVISGHRTSAGKDVFRHIDDLQTGQQIEVGVALDGHFGVYTYVVERVTDMIPNDGTIPQRYFVQQAPYETLSLVACTPEGSISHRVIVLAKLVMINGQGV